ncbi:Sensor protein RstB [Serratia fonticola]|uniref:Sensor protein RstB n=1 Tax=Serratia fonticola TaxID=47917 RepID=A0A4U9U249_SERFO|nr:Sensor protein RstB [Serratia fonticola]
MLGRFMAREALLQNLRGVSYDGMDRSIDVAISRLRRKLYDNALEPFSHQDGAQQRLSVCPQRLGIGATMRKLFVQFFLLLFVCFLVMAMLVGLVYKVTAERAGRQSMDDLMKSSLYLMRSELREIPLKDWNKTIATLDLNLSFKLHIEPLGKQNLNEESHQASAHGRDYCAGRSLHLYAAHSP